MIREKPELHTEAVSNNNILVPHARKSCLQLL